MDHDSVLFMHNAKHKTKFSVYKKVALSNSSNFRRKVVKKFIYLYCLMIKSAKRKLEYDYFKRANICM